jgi:hypothetical protein
MDQVWTFFTAGAAWEIQHNCAVEQPATKADMTMPPVFDYSQQGAPAYQPVGWQNISTTIQPCQALLKRLKPYSIID